jgi:hypothetical protein
LQYAGTAVRSTAKPPIQGQGDHDHGLERSIGLLNRHDRLSFVGNEPASSRPALNRPPHGTLPALAQRPVISTHVKPALAEHPLAHRRSIPLVRAAIVEPASSRLGLTPPMCPTSIRAHRNLAAPLAPDDERLAADRELIPNAQGRTARAA